MTRGRGIQPSRNRHWVGPIRRLLFYLAVPLAVVSYLSGAVTYPGTEWGRATPAELGLDEMLLEQARAYAEAGGGSGLITRHGKVAMAWGDLGKQYDLKSTTKSFGTAALGLAIKDGKVQLQDRAALHHAEFGLPPESNAATGWLEEITLFHLASQTAGFEKPGGYTPLLFPPGTRWDYSDSGPNWLAECLTLAYRRDLSELMFERLFTPIGITHSDLKWRKHAYRQHLIEGIQSREFGSGIHANVDAMARFGYLHLRKGRWFDKQLLTEEFVEASPRTPPQVRGLPVLDPKEYSDASNHYGLLWWNNNDGTLEGVPRDAYWSWGLYDSLILVMPSLDIVVARAGRSWAREPGAHHYDVLRGFFQPIAQAVKRRDQGEAFSAPVPRAQAPYAFSSVIGGIEWADPSSIERYAHGSDNWPVTWADDGLLYTAYGDGRGFEPFVEKKLSLGLAVIRGAPPRIEGSNLRSASIEQHGDGARGRKASGMLMVDHVLYMWVRNATNAQLAWSEDRGLSWSWCDWRFTESFGCPTFLNFGKNYSGARDEYVYVYSHDSDSAYEPADRMVLARVHHRRIRDRSAYEFFAGVDPSGEPRWSKEIQERSSVFTHPGQCYRSGISFHPGLNRYLWCQTKPGADPQFTASGKDVRFRGGLGIFDAPEPRGPWTTVYYTDAWDVGPGETSSFPSKWMSESSAFLLFSGDDYFSVRKATFKDGKITRVAIVDGKWQINGHVTYPGALAEGLLMNVRMVNSTFEDRNKPEFDPGANTAAFIRQIPDYEAHGVRAFTLSLQGGMPGYEGAINSAFEPDGTLQPKYLARVKQVIEACDDRGIAVILSCYYQRQDQILEDEEAVRKGIVQVVEWIRARGFQHVLLEIANEYDHKGFDHEILRSAEGQVELIQLAKKHAPELLVSTSGLGHGRMHEAVARAADFILIHFNGTRLEDIPGRITALKKFNKPIVVNEDDKVGVSGAAACKLSVENGASWGYMNKEINQYAPFEFKGAADDSAVYSEFRRVTTGIADAD